MSLLSALAAGFVIYFIVRAHVAGASLVGVGGPGRVGGLAAVGSPVGRRGGGAVARAALARPSSRRHGQLKPTSASWPGVS